MGIFKKHHPFFLSLLIILVVTYIRFKNGIIQQDNYVEYARHLPLDIKNISFFESRLFPGLPIFIYLFNLFLSNYWLSGYLITILSFVGSYIILYKLTKSELSVLPLVFPPILLNLATLIDTEFPFIFLILLTYYLFQNGKYALSFLLIGISIWFRLAGVSILSGIFVYFLINKDLKKFIINLPYFLIPVLLLVIYNACFYGSNNYFYQIFTYEALHPNRISIGFLQLVEDLTRSYRWGWYRIFVSGLFYIFLYSVIWIRSINKKSLIFWMITLFYLFTLTINLVPFLENLGRYLAPIIPLFWISYYKKVDRPAYVYLAIVISSALVLL
jgi:hypothetical protein